MKAINSWLVFMLFTGTICMAEKMPYRIFTGKGKAVTFADVVRVASKSDVVLFGEAHDNSIVHWLELEFAKDVSQKRPITLGAEMIEADNQLALDQYIRGEINQKQLDTLARLWPNYKTDYKPLVDLAKDKQLKFVATNVPRRYASMVYKGGFEALATLGDNDRKWIAPLPIAYDPNLPGYVKMIAEMGGHGGENLPKAQALKDATMAYFILQHLSSDLFLHFNGTYHSDNYEGIFWYLKKARPELKVITIATVSQKELTFSKENYNKADFIIVTDEDVTKTY